MEWCSAHCKKLTSCQQVNDPEGEINFGPLEIVSREGRQKIYYPQEIKTWKRQNYFL
jgi:hypothetical protein